MDPDPDRLPDRADAAGARSDDPVGAGPRPTGPPPLESSGHRGAAEEFQSPFDPDRAQAAQDAWVSRWKGWGEPGRGRLRTSAATPGPLRAAARVGVGNEGAPPSAWDEAERASRRLWWWSAGLALAVAVAAILGGILLRVPYVALVPGSARDTEPLLAVSGTDEYPSEGELLFTTVRVRQRPNLWEYLWLEFDDDATVVPEEEILGDRTPEENRQVNLSMMNGSKQVAVAVALEELGYDAISTDGVFIQMLVPDSPAEAALELGDTILAIDGTETLTTSVLVDLLAARAPGDEVELTVEAMAGGDPELVTVELAENPDNPGAGFLGIQPIDRPLYGGDLDFTVEIDSGSVGGPSAGLAFTLAVLDQLTEGELTGGAQVAVTGTIHPDGSVGAVGGVLQKTAAVRGLGADAFIVPALLPEAELEAVIERAGDDLPIIPVENLDEALEALAGLGGDVGAVEEYASINHAATGSD